MTEFAANLLIRRLERDGRWPVPADRDAISQVARFAALRENDEPALRLAHSWDRDRQYVIDPLAEKIAIAKADLLYGEDPKVGAAADTDQAALERIVQISDLPSELHHAEQVRVSEGEIWYRLQSSPETVDAPLITFHSREVVSPYFVGAALVAVAFISEFEDPAEDGNARPAIWRHLEIHSLGRVENRLYRGTNERLGDARQLTDFSETQDLDQVWDTGIPEILAGRIVNRRGRSMLLGKSDFDGREQLYLALNEAMTIGVENARLVAKKRAVVSAESVQPRDPTLPDSVDAGDGTRRPTGGATFDAGEDILIAGTGLDEELGKDSAGPFKVLEYSFDAEALVHWQDQLVKVIASRTGLTVAFLGVGDDLAGAAATGTALRVRLLPATSSAEGSARKWDDALPRILMLAQLLDAAPRTAGGFGRGYSKSGEAPAVERTDPLPRDEVEETNRLSTATGGRIVSTRQAVKELHPDWEDQAIDEEVDAIRADVQTDNRLLGLGTPPGVPEEPPADQPPAAGEAS